MSVDIHKSSGNGSEVAAELEYQFFVWGEGSSGIIKDSEVYTDFYKAAKDAVREYDAGNGVCLLKIKDTEYKCWQLFIPIKLIHETKGIIYEVQENSPTFI